MWRLIFLGLIVYLLVVAFKRSTNQIGKNTEEKNIQKNAPISEKEIESMVQCASCSVHLPRSEAFLVNGAFYCSKSHIPK
jgi:hypothetical protein